jgi:hypothetical protein
VRVGPRLLPAALDRLCVVGVHRLPGG